MCLHRCQRRNELVLSPVTLAVLKNFASISPHMGFRKGPLQSTIADSKTVLARAKLDQDLDFDFAVHELPRLLQALSLVGQDADVSWTGTGAVTISGGSKTISYTPSDRSMLTLPPDKEPNFPDFGVEFVVEADVLRDIVKTSDVLGLPNLVIEGGDFGVRITAIQLDNPSSDKSSTGISSSSPCEFKAVFDKANLLFLRDNYTVQLSSKRLSRWKGAVAEYYVALDKRSVIP